MKKQIQFTGKIAFISCSPHGEPEGIVLTDGTFVKVPPHSLIEKDLFEVEAQVSGTGEVISDTPNRVIHHVQLKRGKSLLADDSIPPHERDELKEQHKKELKTREDAPPKKITLKGVVVALGTKPKGEVDRIILADGTSVHVPKDVELAAEDFEIGGAVEIKGELREYRGLRFMKAKSVTI